MSSCYELTAASAESGLSGAPIIRDIDFVTIGVHVRGGSFNFGAVIGGPFGVKFPVYLEALKMLREAGQPRSALLIEAASTMAWLNYIYVV